MRGLQEMLSNLYLLHHTRDCRNVSESLYVKSGAHMLTDCRGFCRGYPREAIFSSHPSSHREKAQQFKPELETPKENS